MPEQNSLRWSRFSGLSMDWTLKAWTGSLSEVNPEPGARAMHSRVGDLDSGVNGMRRLRSHSSSNSGGVYKKSAPVEMYRRENL